MVLLLKTKNETITVSRNSEVTFPISEIEWMNKMTFLVSTQTELLDLMSR